MAKLEKVIKGLECCKNGFCEECPYDLSKRRDDHYCERWQVQDDAIGLLKDQQPRVLSYKEVMESDFVFIELFTDEKDGVEPEFIRAISLFISYEQPDFVTEYEICGHGTREEYMHTWRCWTARPTEEQRKAEPWKECDQE